MHLGPPRKNSSFLTSLLLGAVAVSHTPQPYGLPRITQTDRSQFAPRTQRKSLRRIRAKIAKASRNRNRVRKPAPVFYADPQDDPAYQRFVGDMVKNCRCDYDRPCDGLLAGGLCERKGDRGDSYTIRFDGGDDE